MLKHPVVLELAQKYGKDVGQVRLGRQRNCAPCEGGSQHGRQAPPRKEEIKRQADSIQKEAGETT